MRPGGGEDETKQGLRHGSALNPPFVAQGCLGVRPEALLHLTRDLVQFPPIRSTGASGSALTSALSFPHVPRCDLCCFLPSHEWLFGQNVRHPSLVHSPVGVIFAKIMVLWS